MSAFVRGKHSARSGVAGAGLGLSIVREVASRHRGPPRVHRRAGGARHGRDLWVPRGRAPARVRRERLPRYSDAASKGAVSSAGGCSAAGASPPPAPVSASMRWC